MTDIAAFLNARYDEFISATWERAVTPGSMIVRDEYDALKRDVAAIGEHGSHPAHDVQINAETTAFGLLRMLAEPYRDHADYDPAWRVAESR